MELLKKYLPTIVIVIILLGLFWYFMLRNKPVVQNTVSPGRNIDPRLYYVNRTNPIVMFNRAQEISTLSIASQTLSQLQAQFNSSGCSTNNVINSNSALNELRGLSNRIQDMNTRTAINLFLMSYPGLISDCSVTGITSKGTMINGLQNQLSIYKTSLG